MKKQTNIVLNENDIKEIIAEKYEKDIYDVELKASYGDPQYPSLSIWATIKDVDG